MKLRSVRVLYLFVLCLLLLTLGTLDSSQRVQASSAAAPFVIGTEALPPGVTPQIVLDGLHQPVAMAFDPQGRLFYTERDTGNVRVFANGVLQTRPVITFQVDSLNERGLLGIAVDPNFNQNHFIYVYYTCAVGQNCTSTENRVVRFVENNGTGSSPTTIFVSPQTADHHNGGNIHFGPDGKLYISIGDDANGANSQDVTVKNGKMHRINPDGTMPTDNPVFSQAGALPSLYAIGLRNSFDFTFDPAVPGRIFASENGPTCDDEMNRIEAGYNYGWRADYPCDGYNADPAYNTIAPLWSTEKDCCVVPTGITVYSGNQIPQWHNGLFMATYPNLRLYHFYLNADRTAVTSINIVTGAVASMDIETGPDGSFWYMSGGGAINGTLYHLVNSNAASTPTTPITSTAQPITTATPAASVPVTSTSQPNLTATPVSSPVSVPGTGSRTFPETKQSVSGIFLDYWNAHGALAQIGLPISGLMTEVSDLNGKPYTVQYFERAVMEYHPENQAPYNVLLSQLGTFQYRNKYPQGAPNQQPDSSSGSVLFPETGKRLGGKFLQYWQGHGGLLQQGYPISDPFTEVSDLNGKPYTVQYFERAVFEVHPENASPYDVLLSQLGTFQFRQKYGGK